MSTRKFQSADLNYILDIDLKCFGDNWEYHQWRETVQDANCGILIGTHRSTPVGFITWTSKDPEILRLGVKPDYQHQGIGSQLLQTVEILLAKQGINEVRLPITESLVLGSGKLLNWLLKRGYSAGCLLRGKGLYAGVTEDKIEFRKLLVEVTKSEIK